MPDDYKFTEEDEEIYTMFLATTTSEDVTIKEEFLYKLKRIRFRFNNSGIDKIIKKVIESSEEEFEVFKTRCLYNLGFQLKFIMRRQQALEVCPHFLQKQNSLFVALFGEYPQTPFIKRGAFYEKKEKKCFEKSILL